MTARVSFVLESEWYWRIFEGNARFDDEPGDTAARDFLYPLARLAAGQFALNAIQVDAGGDTVRFRIEDRPFAIDCRGLSVERFVAAVNRGLAELQLDYAFAIVESRRYELRGMLLRADEASHRRFARGTPPATETGLH